MKYVIITGSKASSTTMFEEIGCKGRRATVPTYQAEICDEARSFRRRFSVTRDSAPVVFGHETKRFVDGGECPPNRAMSPYNGRLVTAPRNGRCLALYEPGIGNRFSLRGIGDIMREHILIHATPASSLGCFGVSGRTAGWRSFEEALHHILEPEEEITVFVEPRPQADHDIHLTRPDG